MSLIFSLMRSKMFLPGVIAIVILAYIVSLNYKVKSLKGKITGLSAQIASLNMDIGSRDSTIDLQSSNIIDLTNKLDDVMAKYKKYETSYAVAKKRLSDWKAKPPEVKYVYINKHIIPKGDLSKGECKLGIELNKRIARTKYEDL